MDAAMLWLTLVSALAAIAAAVFAFVQANTAITAQRDAKVAEGAAVAARDAAVKAQQDAAAAGDRIAAVMEQQAAAARADAAVRPDPWELRPGRYTKNGTAMLIVLTGSREVADVSLEIERKPSMVRLDPSPMPSEMRPGDAVELYYLRMGPDSATSTAVVRWRWVDETEVRTTRAALN